MRIMALYRVAGKKLIPVSMQVIKGICYLFFGRKTLDQGMSRSLVNDIRSFPFLILWIFAVAQQENQFSGFPGLKGQINLVAGNRIPSAGYGTGTCSCLYCIRNGIAIASAEEIITAGVKTIDICIDGKEAVMIAAFSVFGLVVNSTVFVLDLSGT